MINFSPEVKAILAKTAGTGFQALDDRAKFLAVLNAKANSSGSAIYPGIEAAEKARRRAKGKLQRSTRRSHRDR